MFGFFPFLCRRLSRGVLVFSAAACTLLFSLLLVAEPEESWAASKGKGKFTPLKLESLPDSDLNLDDNGDTPASAAELQKVPGDAAPPVATSSEDPPAPDSSADEAPAPSTPAAATPVAAATPAAAAKPAAASSPTAAKPIRLFGTVEFRSLIKNLPKWERVRSAESKNPSFTGKGISTQNASVAKKWANVKKQVQNASLMDKMREVNKFFNHWPYKTDREVWGVEDYWATPREFVKKSGDCEDYAISKYYALRDLGVPANVLRVAAIKDTIRNIGHAVLIVYVNNDAYVLDNLTNLVLSHKKLSHYAPQYSVNEEFLWRHVKPKVTGR